MNLFPRQMKAKFKSVGPEAADSLLLFFSAFLLRALSVSRGAGLTGDSSDYLILAKNLAFHHVFSLGDGGPALAPTAFRPPLYPALISLFWWGEEAPLGAVIYLQALLGAATVALVYQIARRHFERRVALIAALAVLIEPFTIQFTSAVMTETLFTFLLVLAAFFWGRKRHGLAGMVFGLAALVRPTVVPFLLILPFLSFFPTWRPDRKAFLTIALFAAAAISPWTLRNIFTFKQMIPISSFGFGMNLLCGTMNVPMLADEGWGVVKVDPAIRQMRRDLANGETEAEADRKLFREAVRRIVSDPAAWLKARAKQYPRLFIDSAPYILGVNNMRFEEAVRGGHWLFIVYKLAFGLRILILVALALAGIFLARGRLAELSHVILFPVFLMLIHVPLWTENRYLLPMLPLVSVMAAFTLDRFLRRFWPRAAEEGEGAEVAARGATV